MNETLLVSSKKKVTILPEPNLPENQQVPKSTNPEIPQPKRQGGKVFWAHNHSFFTSIERQPQKEDRVAILWERDPQGVWTPTARLPYRMHVPHFQPALFPLTNGKVLVFNPNPKGESHEERKKTSPVAVYSRNEKGELGFPSSIDLGLKKIQDNKQVLRVFAFHDSSTIVDDSLVVCSWNYGLFWVFSLEDGRLRRMIRLYDAITDEDVEQARNHHVVINFQPLKDGKLLVATYDEGAIKPLGKALRKSEEQGDRLIQGSVNAEQAVQGYLFQEREREAIQAEFPLISWYEIDPDTGRKQRLENPPHGVPALLTSLQSLDDFFWIPDETGQIRFVGRDLQALNDLASKPEEPSKKTPPLGLKPTKK